MSWKGDSKLAFLWLPDVLDSIGGSVDLVSLGKLRNFWLRGSRELLSNGVVQQSFALCSVTLCWTSLVLHSDLLQAKPEVNRERKYLPTVWRLNWINNCILIQKLNYHVESKY